ncbi:hypothetical protein VII00023_15186 [Vibrio ichthyoenteri ATCC 700023]|uniref:Lipoprotein n=1 Tax=Vibrio ichthyoenteri ATCC 700023 TaxID=870968 RepID=F9S6X0_9VIBR|nr:DUF3833 domain-containing protein [Vibrio ichthyoenteri]EGU32251.1 hypothetical protein VII00023_15186 [Vibrio ichthyoenteri ATCC 700023]
MNVKRWVVVVFTWLLFGCNTQISDYQADNSTPTFNLFEYFVGNTTAWGMVQDFSDKQTRRFEVVIVGTVEGDRLTLVEDFVFDDGEIQQRIWVIERQADGSYRGTANDVVGVALGSEQGHVMHWQYDLQLPWNDGTTQVAMDDWLYRQDEKHLFNITKISKFGIEVGQVTIFFQKQ